MNRLILIGNGFDLAHGMKTGYNHFIEYLWGEIFKELCEISRSSPGNLIERKDKFDLIKFKHSEIERKEDCIIIKVKNATTIYKVIQVNDSANSTENIRELLIDTLKFNYYNKFFEIITKGYITKNWSDVEADYYKALKEAHKVGKESVKTLNKEFNCIKELLKNYLNTQMLSSKNEDIINLIYSPISSEDVSLGSWDVYVGNVYSKLKQCYDNPTQKLYSFFGTPYKNELDRIKSKCSTKENSHNGEAPIDLEKLRTEVKSLLETKSKLTYFHPFFLEAERIMLLNFNYTYTEDPYEKYAYQSLNSKDMVDTCHIHGTLDDAHNHMIFGYGDEEADEYKELENSNIPGLLENVKSINYLEASNYRKMERFIESGPYQIFLMGMSCGLADRTMLRKLFQHKNCLSIKPFYYEWEESGAKKTNYTEIIQNVSRCFSDKDLLRSIVVNRQYCEALPQIDDLKAAN